MARRVDRDVDVVTAIARVDRRTKDLAKRVGPGEIAIIDHEDLDRVAAETLIQANVGAIVNASASISGRYPNMGPLLVTAAGIPLLDDVGSKVMEQVTDGSLVTVAGSELRLRGERIATGSRQTIETLEQTLEASRRSMGDELERFAENTLAYIQKEGHLLVDNPDIPEVPLDFRGRQVLLVVRGIGYKNDLAVLRGSGYLQEMRPLLIGVDGGADALLEIGFRPDVIIGDMDSVSEDALRCGAVIVVHAYTDGEAPGAERLDDLGVEYVVFASVGTSEDVAMLLAYERGAELIVAVGTHNSMVEFLDKGRAGMASTFLVRMKVGPILVDAKGVSRLYENRVRLKDLLLLLLAAIATIVLLTLVSEPMRLVIRGFLLSFR